MESPFNRTYVRQKIDYKKHGIYPEDKSLNQKSTPFTRIMNYYGRIHKHECLNLACDGKCGMLYCHKRNHEPFRRKYKSAMRKYKSMDPLIRKGELDDERYRLRDSLRFTENGKRKKTKEEMDTDYEFRCFDETYSPKKQTEFSPKKLSKNPTVLTYSGNKIHGSEELRHTDSVTIVLGSPRKYPKDNDVTDYRSKYRYKGPKNLSLRLNHSIGTLHQSDHHSPRHYFPTNHTYNHPPRPEKEFQPEKNNFTTRRHSFRRFRPSELDLRIPQSINNRFSLGSTRKSLVERYLEEYQTPRNEPHKRKKKKNGSMKKTFYPRINRPLKERLVYLDDLKHNDTNLNEMEVNHNQDTSSKIETMLQKFSSRVIRK